MRLLAMAGLGVASLLAACGSSSSGGSTSVAAGGSSSGGAGGAPGATVSVGTSAQLGPVLTDASGRTLYYFLPERGGTVACTGGCAATWPAAVVTGTPIAGPGVSGSLGVVARADGSSEVSYARWPLHTYSGDHAPGDTNGQGVDGKWFAATPGLSPDSTGAAASTSTSSSTSTGPGGGYGY